MVGDLLKLRRIVVDVRYPYRQQGPSYVGRVRRQDPQLELVAGFVVQGLDQDHLSAVAIDGEVRLRVLIRTVSEAVRQGRVGVHVVGRYRR